jgi:ribosome recycling factor
VGFGKQANMQFDKAIMHLSEQLDGIRPGSLSVGFIETFRFNNQPLKDIAAITTVKDRIHVTPFDRTQVGAIANMLTSVGKMNAYAFNPVTVCVPIPPLSGEQKDTMAQHIRKLGEGAKIAVRAMRQTERQKLGKDDRVGEKAIQKETDAAIQRIDTLVETKINGL